MRLVSYSLAKRNCDGLGRPVVGVGVDKVAEVEGVGFVTAPVEGGRTVSVTRVVGVSHHLGKSTGIVGLNIGASDNTLDLDHSKFFKPFVDEAGVWIPSFRQRHNIFVANLFADRHVGGGGNRDRANSFIVEARAQDILTGTWTRESLGTVGITRSVFLFARKRIAITRSGLVSRQRRVSHRGRVRQFLPHD